MAYEWLVDGDVYGTTLDLGMGLAVACNPTAAIEADLQPSHDSFPWLAVTSSTVHPSSPLLLSLEHQLDMADQGSRRLGMEPV
jgi:hypothetical protein